MLYKYFKKYIMIKKQQNKHKKILTIRIEKLYEYCINCNKTRWAC